MGAAAAGGYPEADAHGLPGALAISGDAGALADSIDRLLADPELRVRMGKAGRVRAVERFDWDHSVTQFEAVYTTVLATNNK